MPAQKRPVPSGPEEEQPPSSAEGEGAVWTARRADLEWRSRLAHVAVTYRLQVATAATEYQRAVLQVTQEAAEREAGALSRMESESRAGQSSVEDRLAAGRELQAGLLAGRQSSEAALRGAARRLAEELQRAWLEAVDGQQEAHAQYQRALQATLATSAMPGAGPWAGSASPQFAVAADEGPVMTLPPPPQAPPATHAMPGAGPWAGSASPQFAVAADEGPPVDLSSSTIWPGAWISAYWNAPGRW